MTKNLRAEMVRRDISIQMLADFLNVTDKAVRMKLNGSIKFSLEQAFKIQAEYFPDLSMHYLFKEKDNE